mgnify:CR=1 FL=1
MSKISILKKLALIATGAMILPAFAAADIKMGIILGFTGPIESLTPDMGSSAELAFKEASAHRILDGIVIDPIRADSTCVNSSVAVNNAKKLVNKRLCFNKTPLFFVQQPIGSWF